MRPVKMKQSEFMHWEQNFRKFVYTYISLDTLPGYLYKGMSLS